ncbi:MAG: double-strand break repair protein AddB [Alphaproteobacteria bacterium]|nr:double-strand break repair protein AddB [Alphaproteobacteria bacterium]
MRDKVFTIAAGTPFLPALMRAVLNGDLPKPGGPKPDALDLSAVTILLPTRRAERELADACLSVTGSSAMLLPRIRAIAGPDEDALLIDAAAGASSLGTGSLADLELPPQIEKTERLLLLTKLVLHWSERMRQPDADPSGELGFGDVPSAGARTPAQAATMARELAELMDLVEREGCSFDGLADLVPETFSEHWQKSLQFLEIITAAWPAILAERNLLSPWQRQNRLLEAEAKRLRENPPDGPVIVAGVSGSIPATVELMRAVCELEQGAILLQGLDLDLDQESFEKIAPDHPEHPDFGLSRLLSELGVSRADVQTLPDSAPAASLASRAGFISEAMRPTATTDQWHNWVAEVPRDDVAAGFQDVSLISADNPQEEAEAISLILREAAEHEGKTAALVTPDRLLARRVAIRLEAWGIRVDDSAGRPFAKTVPGAFLEVIIDAVSKNFSPVATMALLKHPLTRFGLSAREVRFAARALELRVFRSTYIGTGLEGISVALKRVKAEREAESEALQRKPDETAQKIWEEDWQRAEQLIKAVATDLAPLIEAFGNNTRMPLNEMARLHSSAAEAASRLTPEEIEQGVEAQLYAGEAGTAASGFFTQLVACAQSSPEVTAADYPDLYRSLIGTLPPVIPRVPKHPRISIWGPMESQLLSADVVVLGSLNETTWPDSTYPGPWLNRPMRAQMGLPAPEEEIGREARQFVSLLGANQVYLTRAAKVDGVPSVPSRWLMRTSALLAGLGLNDAMAPSQPWLSWARLRDAAERLPTIRRPEPRPPVDARPRRISVSGVERWISNPYSIFAREILKLRVLPQLGAEPDAALRGQILHEAMSQFAKRHPVELPDRPAEVLWHIAADILDMHASHPRIAAFWIPRFQRFADWFADTEPQRRKGLEATIAELDGRITFDAPGGTFTLTARADRIDRTPGGLIVTDYKTGNAPSDREVQEGTRPQLPLEAAIAIQGGFEDLAAMGVSGLRYIKASGGEPPGLQRDVKVDDVGTLSQEVLDGVKSLVAQFDDINTPYAPARRSAFSYDYDDYAHLARVAEWVQASASDSSRGASS